MKNILITGGSGFIARNLTENLPKYRFFAPNSKELNVLDFNRLVGYVRQKNIDIIIHTAHYNRKRIQQDPKLELEIDSKMFLNIHKVAPLVEKVLYFGSGAEYDKNLPICSIREEAFGRSIPSTQYGLSKYIQNIIAGKSENIYNLRLFGLFGKYEDIQVYLISNLCCKAISNLSLTIRRDCIFDYLYIDDLYDVICWFIENKPAYHDYNICSGKKILLSDIAEKVNTISGKGLPVLIKSEGFNLEYTGDNSRLKSEMTDFQVEKIEESIRKLYHWYDLHWQESYRELLIHE